MDIQSVSSMSGMMGMQGSMMQAPEKPDAEQMSSDFLDAMDSDGDGLVSQTEYSVGDGETVSSESFDALDTNQDGFVSQEELEADARSKIEMMESSLQSGMFSGIEDTGDSEQFQQLLSMMGSSSTDQASGAEAYGQMQGSYDLGSLSSTLSLSA